MPIANSPASDVRLELVYFIMILMNLEGILARLFEWKKVIVNYELS